MLFLQTPVQIGLTVALVVGVVLTIWRGRRPERLAMVGMVLMTVISPLVQDWDHPNATQWGIMATDSAYLLMLVVLTWIYDRAWLVWAAAFQLLTVVTHIGMALNVEILGRAYISSSYLLFAGVLGAVLWGVVRPAGVEHERRGRGG